MLIDVGAGTHIGRKKEKNEDSYGVFNAAQSGVRLFKQGMLLAVADGLGGHIGGDIASKLAVSMVKDALKEDAPSEDDIDSEREDEHYLGVLERAMSRANDSIFQTNRDLIKGKRPMGTTLCAALIRPRFMYVGNVGDSRVYLFRRDRFIVQTEDHSWLDEQVKQGLMSQEDADKDKRKNLVTRCIGTHDAIEVDTYKWKIESGDQVLLCTDGLTNMVGDDAIAEVLRRPHTTQEKVDALIALANENGGKDNITLILALVNPAPSTLRVMRLKAWMRKNRDNITKTLVMGVWGLFCFLTGYAVCFLVTR